MPHLAAWLPEIIRISELAGRAILDLYNTPSLWEVQQKADSSPLTAADLAANRVIVEELARLTPTIPVLSEELPEPADRRAWNSLWLVDPLDGTKEFVARSNDFTVNIALVVNQQAVLGVLHAPVYGVTYAAARGLGAWRYEQGERTRLQTEEIPVVPRVLLSRHHQSGGEAALLERTALRFGDYVALQVGSAFKMCRIAEGAADFYPRFGPTMEWDTAAAQILVEEAGGLLVDTHGQPLRYNARATLVNGAFMVLGEPRHLQEWLTVWQEAEARDASAV